MFRLYLLTLLISLQKRYILEENGDIEPKKSILEDDLDDDDDDEDEDEDEVEEEEEGEDRSPVKHRSSKDIVGKLVLVSYLSFWHI